MPELIATIPNGTVFLANMGLNKMDSNSLLLLTIHVHYIQFAETKHSIQTSWQVQTSKHWHFINCVITHQHDDRDVLITRAMHGVEWWTNHRLVRARFDLLVAPIHHKHLKIIRQVFSVAKLHSREAHQQFQHTLHTKLTEMGRTTNWRVRGQMKPVQRSCIWDSRVCAGS